MSDILVKAEGVSKKFCKSLRHSMFYGIQDITQSMFGIWPNTSKLKEKEFWAVDNISFELKRGECLGLIGPNGSGKSTLLKILNGIISPDKGRVTIKGKVGALIEIGAGFHPQLTGRENIYISGSILGFSKKEIDNKFEEIVAFSELEEFIDMPVKNYSSGMYVRLGFAVAAQMEPDVLLIDEVLAVGDVGFRSRCYNGIHKIRQKAAVIFVSHSMNLISRMCSDVVTLKKGGINFMSNNVPQAIEDYYNLFTYNETRKLENFGSKIYELSVLAEKDGDYYVTSNGNDLDIFIDVEIGTEFNKLEINFTFLSHGMELVAQCNSKNNGVELFNNSGRIKGILQIKDLLLNRGNYFISLSIVDYKTNTIIIWNHLFAKIKIFAPFYGGAYSQLVGDWANLSTGG